MSSRLSPWRVAIALAIVAPVVAAPAARAAAAIRCGETFVGMLASGPDEIGFHAREGEVVSATVVPLVPVAGFVPRWRVADVEGKPVALTNGDHRCVGRCETAPLSRGGAFSLRITDPGVGTGAYVVSLEAVSATANGASNGPPEPTCARIADGLPDGTRAIGDGAVLGGVVDRPGETDTFTLDVAPGARVAVLLRRTGGDAAFAPAWQAFDASGAALARAAEDETAAVPLGGVVTVLVTDAALRATGTYEIGVEHRAPPASTTTSTTAAPGSTSTTRIDGGSTTTTTAGEGSSTSTTSSTTVARATTTTTSTRPGATTTLPPVFDLGLVIAGPSLAGEGMLGGALAAVGGRLLIGAPHEPAGIGAGRVRDAGAVLVVDVTGPIGGPSFARVLARVARPEPARGDALGLALAPAGVGVVVGAPGVRAAFVFPNLQAPDATTLGPPVAADDGFGSAVAAPDGLAVVGAPRAEGDAGVAYVFERSTGAPRAALAPSPAVPGARVGAALAASGTLVLVGAPGGPAVPGQAFLFDAATGALLQTLRPDPSAPGDEFGAAVAFDGTDLLIGAPGTLDERGRVDRFDAATGKPTRSYAPPSPTPGERFGASIAVGCGQLVVGAPGDAGAAYGFDLETGVLEATLRKPTPRSGDALGAAVALECPRVFVGAPGDDAGTLDGGTTYVFEDEILVAALRKRLSPDGFGASAVAADGSFYVGAPAGAGGDGYVARIETDAGAATFLLPPEGRPVRFGAALASLGDLVVVGAPESPLENGMRVGAVHLFDGTALRATIQNPTPGEGDEFGFAVGSVDGDVLASAPFAGESDTGLVYRLDTAGRLRVTYGKPAPTAGDFFGAALAGDRGQVLVGAPLDASGGPPAGAAYLFDGESASIVHTIVNPNDGSDLFGAAVALGQWIVVGAPRAPGDTGSDGTVWVFDRATGALVRRLENPRFGRDDFFGAAVALLGDRLLVGAPLTDDRAADTGIVYLFEPATGQLVQTFRNPPQGPFDNFGFSVAAGGTGLLVGSPGPSRVYVFDPIATAGALRLAAAPLAATATSTCGNGLVEDAEACDDGNDVDTDDCRSDCTPGPCCAIDRITDPERCDDRNPCTTDRLDPVLGCLNEPSGAPGCCESDADCPDGQCRLCVGCFVYRWDCCDVGSTCVPSNPACVGKTCVDAAYCQCEGKLDCGAEALPESVREPFAVACNTLRLQVSVVPETAVTKPELVLARQATRSARAALRKTIRTARQLARKGELSRTCRKDVVAQVRVVRQAIPRGRRLRRCLAGG